MFGRPQTRPIYKESDNLNRFIIQLDKVVKRTAKTAESFYRTNRRTWKYQLTKKARPFIIVRHYIQSFKYEVKRTQSSIYVWTAKNTATNLEVL